MRQRVWAARIQVPSVRNIGFDNATEFELEPEHLVSDDYGPCQDFGERCLRERPMPKVIQVPSAALPGTRNLVIFGPRVAIPYLWNPLDPEDSPTAVGAERAQPLPELLRLVRHFDEPHAEFAAWKQRAPFEFIEPAVTRDG